MRRMGRLGNPVGPYVISWAGVGGSVCSVTLGPGLVEVSTPLQGGVSQRRGPCVEEEEKRLCACLRARERELVHGGAAMAKHTGSGFNGWFLRTSSSIPQRYVIVFLTFLCTCVCYIERVGFSVAYTAAAEKGGVDEGTKGFILSSFFYGYVLSQVPGGWAAQLLGGRRVLLLSFLLWSITCALTPTDAGSVAAIVVARLLVGVAQGFIFPSIHTVLAQWVPPHERSRCVSLTTSGMYFGAAVGMLLLPSIVLSRGPRAVFLVEAAMGGGWALIWLRYAIDPPLSALPKALAAGFGVSNVYQKNRSLLPVTVEGGENGEGLLKDLGRKIKPVDVVDKSLDAGIPWSKIMLSLPVWAIVVSNFTFHYSLYVLMNWLPTYFSQGLRVTLKNLGFLKMLPYLNMFLFSNLGGVIADLLIVRKILSVTSTRKVLNTGGFTIAAMALMVMTGFRSATGAILCSSVCLGFCALSRAGFAVNHMDIAPRYAGIVMGVSNTAGTLAGIVGVGLTGKILETAKARSMDITDPHTWTTVFMAPAVLSLASAALFVAFATGERVFD